MSAFMVGAATMQRVVLAIMHHCPSFNGLPTDRPGFPPGGIGTIIGRELFAMNQRAVNARYRDAVETGYSDPPEFWYRHEALPNTLAEQCACYKAICCLLYQCAEGSVPEEKPYQQLVKLRRHLAEDIVGSLPEYEQAPWGD
jgi:hypothetical protein